MIRSCLLKSIFGSLMLIFPLFSTTYHVNNQHPMASDQHSGTREQPFITAQRGVDAAQPGDTVSIASGNYGEIACGRSGRPNAEIVIKGAGPDSTQIQAAEFTKDVAYISLSDLSVEGFPVWGVFFRGGNHHIHLSRLKVVGGESGIHLTYGYQGEVPEEGPVSDIVIENSEIRDCLYTAVDGTPGPCHRMAFRQLTVTGAGITTGGSWGSDGVAIERGSEILVEYCRIHDNGGDGIDLNSRDSEGQITGNLVRCNQVYRNHRNGVKLWGGGRMENNLIWGQGHTPVVIGDFPGNYEIVNNTIAYNMIDSDFSVRDYSFLAAYPDDDTGVSASIQLTLVNNIFAFNSNEAMGGPTGLYFGEGVHLVHEGNNIYWSRRDGEIQAEFISTDPWVSRAQLTDGSWAASTGQGEGNITEDPLFVSGWPDVNLRLNSSSPAIDHGLAQYAPATDVYSQPRPAGTRADIGAVEYGGLSACRQNVCPVPRICFLYPPCPNPCNHRISIRYTVHESVYLKLKIYTIAGRFCSVLADGYHHPGSYRIAWDALDHDGHPQTSGIYIVCLQTAQTRESQKMMFIQ